MVLSAFEWIACGGLLMPVGHWASQKQLKKKVQMRIETHEKPFVYREVYESQPISPIYLENMGFSHSSLPPYRIALSEESHGSKQVFASMETLPSQIISEKKSPQFPIEVRTYKFPKGYVACPRSRLLASSREELMKDILQIQRGKTLFVAGATATVVGISWLFYGMTPEKDTEPVFFGLFRNSQS